MLAWLSMRDTGAIADRCAVHMTDECPIANRKRTPLQEVRVVDVDPEVRICDVAGLGRRRRCFSCWPDDVTELTSSELLSEAAQLVAPSSRPAVKSQRRGRPSRPREKPVLPPAVRLPEQLTGWLLTGDGVEPAYVRHAVHATRGCTVAHWRDREPQDVALTPLDLVVGRAGWLQAPAASSWVEGVGRRRLCRVCWQPTVGRAAAHDRAAAEAAGG